MRKLSIVPRKSALVTVLAISSVCFAFQRSCPYDVTAAARQAASVDVNHFSPDLSINSILKLEDPRSLEMFSDAKTYVPIERLRESPVVLFTNTDKTEYLLAYCYEGDSKNAFACFEIGAVHGDDELSGHRAIQTSHANFHTESGLRLGISKEELVEIKGSDFESEKQGDSEVLIFTLTKSDAPEFLNRYNMPGYFMKITLLKNKVSTIYFGFESS